MRRRCRAGILVSSGHMCQSAPKGLLPGNDGAIAEVPLGLVVAVGVVHAGLDHREAVEV